MKISFVIAVLAFITSPVFAAEKLHLDIMINGEAQSFSFDLAREKNILNASTMKIVRFEPTSGDCSNLDVSRILSQYPSGLDLKVVSSPLFEGKRMFQISLTHSELLGTSAFQVTKSCSVNNVRGRKYEGDNTVLLKQGEILDLELATDGEFKPGGISIKAVWR